MSPETAETPLSVNAPNSIDENTIFTWQDPRVAGSSLRLLIYIFVPLCDLQTPQWDFTGTKNTQLHWITDQSEQWFNQQLQYSMS